MKMLLKMPNEKTFQSTFRNVKKKPVKPTISQMVIKTNSSNNDNKVYYTNDQLLMERIIELNSKVDKLMTKHKKLKRKYQTLSADIYVDDNEETTNYKQTENKNKTQPDEESCEHSLPPHRGCSSWRN